MILNDFSEVGYRRGRYRVRHNFGQAAEIAGGMIAAGSDELSLQPHHKVSILVGLITGLLVHVSVKIVDKLFFAARGG